MFRVLLFVAEIAAVLFAVRWVLTTLRGSRVTAQVRLERGARWETHTESRGGRTAVLVRRIAATGKELGRQVIAEIPDAAPDWEMRYHEAMAEARSRLAALEAQRE
jgi:hypothetical protein